MKKAMLLTILFTVLTGCSLGRETVVYPKANSEYMSIDGYILSPDGRNIAISSDEGNFTYDARADVLNKISLEGDERLNNYIWVTNDNKWELIRYDFSSKSSLPEEKLIFSEDILQGEIYDQIYNPLGTLELRLINWKGSRTLVLASRSDGNFNVVGDMDGVESIKYFSLSPDIAIIREFYDGRDSCRLYLKNAQKLVGINKTDVNAFYNSLIGYFEGEDLTSSKKFYKRAINLGNFEIIDLSYRNNLILFVDNNTKKFMAFDMNSRETASVNTTGVLNAVSLNNSEIYAIVKEDEKFKVQRINFKNGEYNTIFSTNEFVYKLWEHDGKIFFAGVIIEPKRNKYKFYRVIENGVENLFQK